MLSREEILEQLKKITALEGTIERRIIEGLLPAYDITGVPLTEENIQTRVEELAEALASSGIINPILISVMDGAMPFASLLQKQLYQKHRDFRFQYTTMQASSYVGTASERLSLTFSSKIPLGGRQIIVVEDVLDTGKTYFAIKKQLELEGATKVSLMTLIDKVQERHPEASAEFYGFQVDPKAFLLGCGMDYDTLGRNHPCIGTVNRETLPEPDEKEILALKPHLNAELKRCIAAQLAAPSPGRSPHALFAGGSGAAPAHPATTAHVAGDGPTVGYT